MFRAYSEAEASAEVAVESHEHEGLAHLREASFQEHLVHPGSGDAMGG